MPDPQTRILSRGLLDWYDNHHRDLPWRIPPARAATGARLDPYHVWLSEIMLQQTTVRTVKPYFAGFLELWPDIFSLAAADRDEVMKAWAGLGYYSRARNLKKCAEIISSDHAGRFPDSVEELRKLPGIGEYTASAIAAIAYGAAVPVVDGNVERVVSRIAAIGTPPPAARTTIRRFVANHLCEDRPGDFAQAAMDLGALICTPRKPACIACPLRECCRAFGQGDPERYPVKVSKKPKPLRRGAAFVAVRGDGAVLLRKRAESGLLGGMAEVPTTDWSAGRDGKTGKSGAPFTANWRIAGEIRHVFTHFELELAVFRANLRNPRNNTDGWWSPPAEIPGEALPAIMKKVIEAAVPGATKKRRPLERPST